MGAGSQSRRHARVRAAEGAWDRGERTGGADCDHGCCDQRPAVPAALAPPSVADHAECDAWEGEG